MVDVVGTISSVVGIAEATLKHINAVRLAHNNFKDSESRWNQLVDKYVRVGRYCKRIEEEISAISISDYKRDVLVEHMEQIKASLKNGQQAVESISKISNSVRSAGVSNGTDRKQSKRKRLYKRIKRLWKKTQTIAYEAVNVSSITESVETLENCTRDALQQFMAILNFLSTAELENMHKCQEASDVFEENFDTPTPPPNVVLDMKTRNDDGTPSTGEGKLKQKVLSLVDENSPDSESAFASVRDTACIFGMGGVGKSVALQALCHDKDIRNAYKDGVCFLVLGQDANDEKVINEIADCVRKFGGKKVANEIRKMENLSSAVAEGASWFAERAVLFVCDDVWPSPGARTGYLGNIRKLMSNAPESRLVISTRDRKIASEMNVRIELGLLEAKGDAARKILLKNAFASDSGEPGLDEGALDESVLDESLVDANVGSQIEELLETCAGLPLALAIAGSTLKREVEDCGGSIELGIEMYCSRLKEDIGIVTEESLGEHPGLCAVMESSLRHCRMWGMSERTVHRFGRNFDMRKMFESLCVLEKQMVMPIRILKVLWDVDERNANAIVQQFVDCSLVKREIWIAGEGTLQASKEYGLRLHDLVLGRCQMVAENKKTSGAWHKQILDAYIDVASGGDCSEAATAIEESRAWWDARDDGYIHANVCRHLARCGLQRELELLVCDIRWTLSRLDVGGWIALNRDFDICCAGEQISEEDSILKVWNILERSWSYIQQNRNEIGFQVFGRIGREERGAGLVRRFLSTVHLYAPRPWLRPVDKCFLLRDGREVDVASFPADVQGIVQWKDSLIAVTSGSEIHIWCTKRKQILCTLRGHELRVTCIALSADGSEIFSGSEDSTIRRWNLTTGECIGDALDGHGDGIRCIAVSPNGKEIVSASYDGTIRRWDVVTGTCIGDALRGHEDSVTCLAFSPDGKQIFSGSFDKTIRRWNASTGECVGHPLRRHEAFVTCLCVSPDGKRIFSGSHDGVLLSWDADTGESIGNVMRGHESRVTCIAFSPDGRQIITGSMDMKVRRWDVNTGECIGDVLCGHDGGVTCVIFSPDGNQIFSGSYDKTIRRWKVASTESIGDVLHGHEDWVTCIAVSPDGKQVVSGSDDKTILRWKTDTGELAGDGLLGHEDSVTCIAFSPSGKLIISGSEDCTIRRWDAEAGEHMGDALQGHDSSVICIAVSPDGKHIFSGAEDSTIRRWKTDTGEFIGNALIGHEGFVRCIAVSPDGKQIISGADDGEMRRWDIIRGEPIGEALLGHESYVARVAFSVDGEQIVSGSEDGTLRRWDANTSELICRDLDIEAVESFFSGEDFVTRLLESSSPSMKQKTPLVGYHDQLVEVYYDMKRTLVVGTMPSMCCSSFCDISKNLFVFGLRNGQVVICSIVQ